MLQIATMEDTLEGGEVSNSVNVEDLHEEVVKADDGWKLLE